jgi:hypothetical protein
MASLAASGVFSIYSSTIYKCIIDLLLFTIDDYSVFDKIYNFERVLRTKTPKGLRHGTPISMT